MVSMTQPIQQAFNPYTENGGTILAIAGADFSVIAGDTRQSEGYSIQTRYAPKVFKLWVARDHLTPLWPFGKYPVRWLHIASSVNYRTDKATLAVNGFAADGNMFVKKVRQRLEVRTFRIFLFTADLIIVSYSSLSVVSPCACKGHAYPCNCASHPNHALCQTFLPILCLQHSWRHRRGWWARLPHPITWHSCHTLNARAVSQY